jgi:hypothetical protein
MPSIAAPTHLRFGLARSRRLRHAATLGLAAKRPTVDNLTSGTIVAVGAGEQER